jgi:hypothetical protein
MRAIAIAASLIVAAVAAAPAWADDTGGGATVVETPSPGDGGSGAVTPPPNPDPGPTTDTGGSTPTTTDGSPSAADPIPPADTGNGSGTDPGGSANTTPADDFSGSGDDKTQKRSPVHDQSSDSSSASSSPASTAPSTTAAGSPGDGGPPTDPATGYQGEWAGQDSFLVDATSPTDSGGAAAGGYHGRFSGLFAFGAASRASRLEAKARRGHDTAKVSALGGGTPGGGGQLPGQNPFFNLLSGPGGAAAGMMLMSLLAVLGASIALPRNRLNRFRTPTVTWSPLAYVPPIELPG